MLHANLSTTARVRLGAVGLALCLGLNWVVTSATTHGCGPLLFGAVTSLLGAACLIKPMRTHGWPGWGAFAGAGIVGIGAYLGLALSALHQSGAGATIFFTYCMPLWAGLLAWLWLGVKPSRLQAASLAIMAVGLGLALLPNILHGVTPAAAWGDAKDVASGLCLAVGTVTTGWFLARRPGYSPLALAGWQMLGGGSLLLAWHFMAGEMPTTLSLTLLAGVLYGGLLCGACSWALWNFITREASPTGAGLVSLAIPVVGVLSAWWLLGEKPPAYEVAGLALLSLASGLAILQPRPPSTTPSATSPTMDTPTARG